MRQAQPRVRLQEDSSRISPRTVSFHLDEPSTSDFHRHAQWQPSYARNASNGWHLSLLNALVPLPNFACARSPAPLLRFGPPSLSSWSSSSHSTPTFFCRPELHVTTNSNVSASTGAIRRTFFATSAELYFQRRPDLRRPQFARHAPYVALDVFVARFRELMMGISQLWTTRTTSLRWQASATCTTRTPFLDGGVHELG